MEEKSSRGKKLIIGSWREMEVVVGGQKMSGTKEMSAMNVVVLVRGGP